MASPTAPLRSGEAEAGDVTVVAEGLSRRYASKRRKLFPPVVSIFHRRYFSRSSDEAEERKSPPAMLGMLDDVDDDLDDLDDDDDDDFEDEEELEEPVRSMPDEWVWSL